MKILISGASGFVGTNLISSLAPKYDILTLGLPSEDPDFTWEDLKSLPEEGIDAYIHLAGKAHDTSNTSDPQSYFDINTGLTEKLYAHYLRSQAKKFIQFSSVKAIADTVEGVLEEEHPANPQTPYGKSKLDAEKFIFSKSSELNNDQKFIIFRPCMIHGPGNKGNLNLLYSVVKKGIPYPLAAFENKRSFLSIDNLIFVIEQVLNTTDMKSGAYQVADDSALSTNELIQVIGEAGNRKAALWRVPKGIMVGLAKVGGAIGLPLNPERLKKLTESYVVSNEKIKKELRISMLPTSAKDGLIKTIKSFQ